jgi:hypothetical protein
MFRLRCPQPGFLPIYNYKKHKKSKVLTKQYFFNYINKGNLSRYYGSNCSKIRHIICLSYVIQLNIPPQF